MLHKIISAALLTVAFLWVNDALSTPTMHPVLEVAIFHTKPSISSKTIIAAANKVTPVLNAMPGFISRTVGQGKSNHE